MADGGDTSGAGWEGPPRVWVTPTPFLLGAPSPNPSARRGHARFLSPQPHRGTQVAQPLELPHPTKVHRAPKFGAFCPETGSRFISELGLPPPPALPCPAAAAAGTAPVSSASRPWEPDTQEPLPKQGNPTPAGRVCGRYSSLLKCC